MINNETTNTPFFTIRREGIICLILVIAILVVYWQVGNHEFIMFDDDLYVTENPNVQAGLSLKSVKWAFTVTHAHNWHPLTWLSHMLDCQIYGLNPGGHHLTNVILHILNSILLFLIFRRMTGALWKSAFVAALFALHPLHVESVAWVAERKDVLSTFFWMLTMGAYVLYVENPGIKRYLLTVLFFALGLMAKPMLVTLPFVLLLLDYWPLGRFHIRHVDDSQHTEDVSRKDTRRNKGKPRNAVENAVQADKNTTSNYRWSLLFPLLWEKIPFFILAAVSSVVTVYAQQEIIKTLELYPLGTRISNALVSYVTYMGKMLVPTNLGIFYPYAGNILTIWQIGGSILLLAGITVLVILAVRRPYLTVGWLWYLGTLVPVIGLVQVGLQSMADRYTYIPLIGIFIIISWGAPDFLAKMRYRKTVLAVSTGVLVLTLMTMAVGQVKSWRSDITLFKHATEVTRNNWLAHYNLGIALQEQNKVDEAIAHYAKALKIKPHYSKAHCNMGNALQKQGKIDEAIAHYYSALKIMPDYAKALYNLGVALQEQGKIDEAIAHYYSALKIKPDHASAHYNLGNALATQGRLDEAISHYSEALRINPDDDDTRANIQVLLTVLKETDKDIKRLKELLENNPGDPGLHYILGNQYYKRRDFEKSIYQYQKALSIQPNAVPVLNNLAIVYMAKRDYEKAVSVFGRIADLQPDNASVYYNIACVYSIQNKTKESLDLLKMAIEKGYDNWEHIRTDKDLKNIRNSLYYKEIMSNH